MNDNDNATTPPATTPSRSSLNGHLSDELLSRVFSFLGHGTTTTPSSYNKNALHGVRHVMLVCRRWKDVLYQAQFWKVALVPESGASASCQHRIGQALLLATPVSAAARRAGINDLNFHGFIRIETQSPKLPNEKRFLVREHWSQRRLVISSVTISMEPGHEPRELVERLQVVSRLGLQGELTKHPYFKVGISIGTRLIFVQCMDERLIHHLDSTKFRSLTLSPIKMLKWENHHGSLPELQNKWPSIVDWIFEISLWYEQIQ